MEIILKGLPKHSLNEIYSGKHWTKRNSDKNTYKIIILRQFKHVLSKFNQYEVDYEFGFKNNPLDASNCVYSLKMIEDVIFEDDKYDIVKKVSVSSVKSKESYVKIKIKTL